jgi:hypothetical protein
MSPQNFEALCAFALNVIGDSILGELHILGDELKLTDAIPHYAEALEELDKVQVFAFADKTLQGLGETSRYTVHPGELRPMRTVHLPQVADMLEPWLRTWCERLEVD